MVNCQKCGKPIKNGPDYEKIGTCKECLVKERPKEYTKEQKVNIMAGMGSLFKPPEKKQTVADKNPLDVGIGNFLGGGREPENKPAAGQNKPPEPEMEPCKVCRSSIPKGAHICPVCKTNLDEWDKKEDLAKLGTGGKLLESLKGGLKGRAKDLKGKTLGEVKNRLDTAQSHVMNNVKFSIYFPLAILSVFRLLVPTVEGYAGTTIVPSYVQNLMWSSWPIILAGLFGVALPPSIILGKSGVSFDVLNKACLFSIAGSAAIWGGNAVLIPAVKTFMPEEYAIMMCMLKYRGNMQICIAQNQTVQYQKTGTYETLDMELGAVTPSQTIPPPNPIPDMWSSDNPYELPFTLTNKNEVGSVYDITVNNINVSASPFEDDRDVIYASEDQIINMPVSIKPGGSVVVTALFDRTFYSTILEKLDPLTQTVIRILTPLDNCKQYTYFRINITTDQLGGGSAKFGLIDNDEGIDNQNFMYFFNPDVKTDTGPVDIYTYTLPFVIPVNTMRATGKISHFGVYIKIENKGDGLLKIQNLTLMLTGDKQNNLKILSSSSYPNNPCRSSDSAITFSQRDCSGDNGQCILIEDITPIGKKNSVTIRCDGNTGSEPFIGKTTDLISVNSYYRYVQSFDEQIACTKNEGLIDQYCMTLNETICSYGGSACHWCNQCNGPKMASHINCTSYTDCGYNCVKDQCGAQCGSDADCKAIYDECINNGGQNCQQLLYCTQDCRCFLTRV
jgi:hypothetical protein